MYTSPLLFLCLYYQLTISQILIHSHIKNFASWAKMFFLFFALFEGEKKTCRVKRDLNAVIIYLFTGVYMPPEDFIPTSRGRIIFWPTSSNFSIWCVKFFSFFLFCLLIILFFFFFIHSEERGHKQLKGREIKCSVSHKRYLHRSNFKKYIIFLCLFSIFSFLGQIIYSPAG